MLCITSFTIVLTLGGGPAATTLEVAIYQALRFDFDPARAVTFTLLQIALTAIVMFVLTRLGANAAIDASLPVCARVNSLRSARPEAAFNAALIVLALIFVAGPIAATVISGLAADLSRLAGDADRSAGDGDQHRPCRPLCAPVGRDRAVAGRCEAGPCETARKRSRLPRKPSQAPARASCSSCRRSSSAPAGSCCSGIRISCSPLLRSWS